MRCPVCDVDESVNCWICGIAFTRRQWIKFRKQINKFKKGVQA